MIVVPDVLVVEEFPETTCIRILVRRLFQPEQLDAVESVFGKLIDGGKERFVVDLSSVDYFSSLYLGLLLKLRDRLRRSSTADSSGRAPISRTAFVFFEDQAEAIGAIRNGESDVLLLCGVSPEVRCVFQICGLG